MEPRPRLWEAHSVWAKPVTIEAPRSRSSDYGTRASTFHGGPLNERIRSLVEQIHDLEEELRTVLYEQETRVLYQITGKHIDFEQAVKETHRRLKIGLVTWFLESRPQNIISAPLIYGMFFPILIYDVCLSVYQAVCFRLYGIPLVDRSSYVVIDRQHLSYLNLFERLNCAYCGYANGVIAYAREITARTEQYWCPIKHARKVLGSHARYAHYLDYGEAEEYPAKLQGFRQRLARARKPKAKHRAK